MRIKQNVRKIVSAMFVATVATTTMLTGHSLAQQANTANTLKVSPLRTDVTADPGETKTVKIIVTNPSSSEVAVRPIQNDFVADKAEDGSPAIILDEDEYAEKNSLKRFLVPLESFTLGPEESRTVEVTIAVPEGAEAGGYFGAIRFAPTSPDDGGQVNTSPSVASLILLRVSGPVSETLQLTDFQLRQSEKATNFLTTTENLSILTRFKNDSTVQLAPFGMISVQRGDDVVYSSSFNSASDQRDVVLPASARRWDIPVRDIEGFGRYKVTSTFTYGSNNQTIEATQEFWVVPIPIIISAVVGLVALVATVVFVRMHMGSRSKGMSLRR